MTGPGDRGGIDYLANERPSYQRPFACTKLSNCFEKKSTRPPKTLIPEAKRWWRKLVEEFEIEDEAGQLLLQTALEAFGTMRSAQNLIATEGLVVVDRFGQKKGHPAAVIERDARAQMLLALRNLNLDVEPLKGSTGRPTGS